MTRTRAAIVALCLVIPAAAVHGQQRVAIPFLASVSKPAGLEFEGAECELDAGGTQMDCAFQQVFLTTSDVAPDTCLVTTNRYERRFARESAGRWISRGAPEGQCGLTDVTTLQDEGSGRWTLEMRRVASRRNASASCAAFEAMVETLSWQNIRRPLPCRFVQPGAVRP